MTGFVRQSAADIVPTAVVRAAPINNELNALRDAFEQTGGHKHDGTAAEGHYVPLIADSDARNKVAVDTVNNRVGVFAEVGGVSVEQVRVQDGAIVPVVDNDINLGTASLEFKDLFIDGTANIDSLIADTADINAGTIDNTVVGATTPAAATVTSLTVNTAATIASADINAGTIDGAVIGGTSAQAITGTTVTATTGFAGNLTGNVTGNLTGNVTGNITGNITGNLTGNVTAASGSSSFNDVVINGNLDMNASTAATITNLSSPTNAADAATKGYVDTSIAALIDTAPGTLDTLNELAAALGDDPNFATTVSNEIATKVSKAGDTMTGALAMSTNKITGVGNPTANQDAATKVYVDTADALKLNLAGGTMSGAIAMGTNKITGLGTPTADADATTKLYVDGILGSATAAATSAAAAATSASNAASSASAASTSASGAAASASNALSSANAAAASFDSFDDRYLGPKASAPTLDNDGDALLTGAIYWNTTLNGFFVWTGSAWTQATLTSADFVTLTGTQTLTNKTITGGTVNPTTLQEGGVAAVVQTDIGTAPNEIPLNQYLGNLAYQDAANIAGDLRAGSINNTPIGATTANTGAFTTLTTSSTVTLNGGTANGVAYLNGSKVLTTGSALTFDGTNFATTGNANLGSASKSTDTQLNFLADTGTQRIYMERGSRSLVFYDVGSAIENYRIAGITGIQSWGVGGSEQMRLTSTGLGIGTSSPGAKLDVNGGVNSEMRVTTSGSGYLQVGQFTNGAFIGTSSTDPTAGILRFGTGGTERARIDSSGNLGLGVTPSAWESSRLVFQNGAASVASAPGNRSVAEFHANSYISSGGTFRYIYSANASLYQQVTGEHRWYTAPSGTAGNAISFSQSMTLDASGNLGVGITAPVPYNAGGRVIQSHNAGGGASELKVTNATTGTSASAGLTLLQSGLDTYVWNGSNSFMAFGTNNTERARIDSSGNLLLGTTTAYARFVSVGGGAGSPAGAFLNNSSSQEVAGFLNQASGASTLLKFFSGSFETQVGSVTTDGSAVAYNTSSDYRLKNITGPITTSGAYIDSLNPVEGTWKADGSTFVGLIAHEVQEASRTNVATGVKDGEQMQGMDYSSAEIIANLIAELQSVRKRLAALESI
jgi:hypothetical protein